jgi:hypothetical protein
MANAVLGGAQLSLPTSTAQLLVARHCGKKKAPLAHAHALLLLLLLRLLLLLLLPLLLLLLLLLLQLLPLLLLRTCPCR